MIINAPNQHTKAHNYPLVSRQHAQVNKSFDNVVSYPQVTKMRKNSVFSQKMRYQIIYTLFDAGQSSDQQTTQIIVQMVHSDRFNACMLPFDLRSR